MQRVLFDVLGDEPKSTTVAASTATRDDGKFAEENYNPEARGDRPGAAYWKYQRQNRKDWRSSRTRMYTQPY